MFSVPFFLLRPGKFLGQLEDAGGQLFPLFFGDTPVHGVGRRHQGDAQQPQDDTGDKQVPHPHHGAAHAHAHQQAARHAHHNGESCPLFGGAFIQAAQLLHLVLLGRQVFLADGLDLLLLLGGVGVLKNVLVGFHGSRFLSLLPL